MTASLEHPVDTKPLIEVHVTNIHQRSVHYQESYVSLVAQGVICGLGPGGYLEYKTNGKDHTLSPGVKVTGTIHF